jgi:hypothetical protein
LNPAQQIGCVWLGLRLNSTQMDSEFFPVVALAACHRRQFQTL